MGYHRCLLVSQLALSDPPNPVTQWKMPLKINSHYGKSLGNKFSKLETIHFNPLPFRDVRLNRYRHRGKKLFTVTENLPILPVKCR